MSQVMFSQRNDSAPLVGEQPEYLEYFAQVLGLFKSSRGEVVARRPPDRGERSESPSRAGRNHEPPACDLARVYAVDDARRPRFLAYAPGMYFGRARSPFRFLLLRPRNRR